MFMRRRPLLRAAAVGGTAYVAGRHMANKANEQAAYEDQQDQRNDPHGHRVEPAAGRLLECPSYGAVVEIDCVPIPCN